MQFQMSPSFDVPGPKLICPPAPQSYFMFNIVFRFVMPRPSLGFPIGSLSLGQGIEDIQLGCPRGPSDSIKTLC
jgi:hypothetical protein